MLDMTMRVANEAVQKARSVIESSELDVDEKEDGVKQAIKEVLVDHGFDENLIRERLERL